MIPPEDFGAIPLGGRLPVDLEFVRDIEEFDGPLLSEFRSSDGETFLYYWCSCNDHANRWLIVRAPRQDLFRYLVGRTSLRDLIQTCPDRFLYMVDMDGGANLLAAWFLYVDKLPDTYLPGPNSVREPGSGVEPGFQDVYIDQKWDYEQYAAYPRKYLQAYALHTAFGRGGDPRSLSANYHLTKGWIFHTLYEHIITNTPPAQRASLDAVSFASPGYLRFRVDSVIAAGLRDAVAQYMNRRSELRGIIEDLRTWANGRSYLHEVDASHLILRASDAVGIDGSALLSHIDTVENASKLFLSYVARLEFLAEREREHTVMLVGLMPGAAKLLKGRGHDISGLLSSQ